MKKDIFINLVITIGISLTAFMVNKYFALYLGAEYLGLMKLFVQLLNCLNLAEIGLASASSYALYKPLAKKDYLQVSITLNTIKSLYNKIFLFILIIGLALNPLIPFFIKNEITDKIIYIYWSLYVFSTAMSYSNFKYSLLFTADQRYGLVRLVEGISTIGCQILQIYMIVKYKSFLFFIILLICNSIFQFISYKYIFIKDYTFIVQTEKREKSVVSNLKKLFWHKLSGVVVQNTDFILISIFISLEIVGIYSSYMMIIGMIVKILNIVFNVLSPRIGKIIAVSDIEIVFDYFKKLNILFWSISLFFSFMTYELIDEFMLLWLDKSFVLPSHTVLLIMINLFLYLSSSIVSIFKQGNGYFDDIHLPIFESLINFILSIVLVQYIKLDGIIIGTICSNVLIISIARPILVLKKCFNKNIYVYFKIYINYIFLTIVSLCLLLLLTNIINFSPALNWYSWLKKACTLGIISLIVIFSTFYSNRDFRSCLFFLKKNR